MESAYRLESLERLTATSQTLERHLASVRSSGQISQSVAERIRHEWRLLSDQLTRMGILQSWLLDSAATEGWLSYSGVASSLSLPGRTTAVRATFGMVGSPLTSQSYPAKESEPSSPRLNEISGTNKQRDVNEEANSLNWHRRVDSRLDWIESATKDHAVMWVEMQHRVERSGKMLEELRAIQRDQLQEMKQWRDRMELAEVEARSARAHATRAEARLTKLEQEVMGLDLQLRTMAQDADNTQPALADLNRTPTPDEVTRWRTGSSVEGGSSGAAATTST